MNAHTPGPWSGGKEIMIRAVDQESIGYSIIFVNTDSAARKKVAKANARLIAAAPNLLDALEMLYSETVDYIKLNNLGGMDNQCMKLASAAIFAATGKPGEQT